MSILLLSLLPPAVSVARADADFIASKETHALSLPFSDAVRIDNLLILSGQLGVDPATFKLVDGGIEAETRQIFSNMQRILALSGTGLDAIVKCTVMIADIAEWPLFNSIYVLPRQQACALGVWRQRARTRRARRARVLGTNRRPGRGG